MIDRETIEESLNAIKLNLQGGFVKLQHKLKLTITPYEKIISARNKLVFLETLR